MLFQLNINLTEDDYLAFNSFHAFESSSGKRMVRRSRTLCMLITAFLSILLLFYMGFSIYYLLYLAIFLPSMLLYMVFYKKVLSRNMKEISASSRTEHGYNVFERVCIKNDRYIFLFKSSITAYILPIAQIKEQLNLEDLMAFLSQKCANVEFY